MAFLFVVHVPYTPRAEKPGFGSKKETGASGEILEPVTEEDTDNKECLEPEDSSTEPGQTQTDVVSSDVNRPENEGSGTQSDETEGEPTDKSNETATDIKVDSKGTELASKTEQHSCDTKVKDEKEDEAAILVVTDTENIASELPHTDNETASQNSKTGSPSKNSDTSEDKEIETVIRPTKTFDVIPVEEKEINIDSDVVENGADPEVKSDEIDKDSSEKDDTATSDRDDGKDGDDDDSKEKAIEDKHLTPLIQIDPMHEEVLEVLKGCHVENVSQQIVGEGKLMRISFVKEDSKSCEEILNKLKAMKVSMKPGSSISVFPTSVHESYSEKQNTEPSTPVDEKEPSIEAQEKESKFKKSIKSRLIVQQVVDSIRGNAEFTFDYLLLVILASLIACIGLVENSSVVLVASMLISPLMGPILAGTFGHVIKKYELRNLGVKSEIKGLLICVLIGFLFGLIAGGFGLNGAVWGSSDSWPTIEMKSRGMTRSLWVGVLIAIPSGAGVAIGILGGNAGSLVGVAISASLLPPAVNAGMLWAYGLLTAVKPPDVIINAVITPTTTPSNITEMGNYTTLSPNTIASTSLPPLSRIPESCLPLVNNEYRQFYSCNISHDAALLGLVSLFLTILNITCIFFMGILVLKIKEVAPYDAGTNFWQEDVKVARTYYETSKGPHSVSLGRKILKEWQKFKEELESKQIPEEQKQLQQNVEIVNCVNYINNLENDPFIQRIMARLSPSDTCLGLAEDLRFEYQAAKDHVDEQYRKDPSIYLARRQPKARNKKVEKAYHTIHHVTDDERKPSLAELRSRFKKGGSLYIDNVKADSDREISPPAKKKSRTNFALLSPTQNKLFKRRKVKFQDDETEEGENLV